MWLCNRAKQTGLASFRLRSGQAVPGNDDKLLCEINSADLLTINWRLFRRTPIPTGARPWRPPDYQEAIRAHRTEHPAHGTLRIAGELRADFPQAHRTAIWRVLRQAGRSRRVPKKTPRDALVRRAPPGADGRTVSA